MKNIALYCRVSSDDQKERDTIENQVEILETYLEMNKESMKIYKKYLDNGVSGTVPFDQRPEGKKLIQDASNNFFDAVLVWKIDRFGRDTLSGLEAIEMLRKYNIEIISVTEPFDLNTPTGRFQFITYLNMAELERNNILDRMFIGATRAAKQGKWMGGIVPYGYTKNQDGYLEVNDKEAEIVKKIYTLYANDKMSTIDIAVYLNNLNIPSSCGTGKGKRTKNITLKWRASTIQRMLSSTTYKGIHEYGKRASRRKETILRKVPAIVDTTTWDKAQRQKKENSIMSKRNNTIRKYLLRGLIRCKYCGKTFYGIGYKNRNASYVCSGKRGENKRVLGIKCTNLNINADMLEEAVWNDCLHILKNYDYYIKELQSKDTKDNDYMQDLQKLNRSLAEKKNEKNNILTLFRKGIITETDVTDQLKDIKREENKIINLIDALKLKINSYKHKDNLISNMSSKLKYYYNKLDNLSFEEKYNIVKLLVKEIIAETVIEDGIKKTSVHVVYNLVKLDTHTDMDS